MLIAGNWKMFKGPGETRAFLDAFRGLEPPPGVDVVLCPPYVSLVAAVAQGHTIYAQNVHWEPSGAYTGEVSPAMLSEVDAHGVVLGHSERRQYYGESDRALQRKVPKALEAGLTPILCVGETEEERERGETERRLRHQVQEGLEAVPADRLADVVIAYEPVWAIGTGRTATPEQAQEAVAFVRALVAGFDADAGESIRVLYGGSVKTDNIGELMALPDVDGALVGGASLDPAAFAQMVEAAQPA